MDIYERIFARLEKLHMSQIELSRRTGIATSTISDWRKKRINPQADKLVIICKALDISLVELLCDTEDKGVLGKADYIMAETDLIELFRKCDYDNKKRMLRYFEAIQICDEINRSHAENKINRNISIIQDLDGNSIVVINDIIFKGKRSVKWKEVRNYLKSFIGEFYTIASTGDVVYIGSDLPSEFSGSDYTRKINGTIAKAKANAAQGIGEMLEIAKNESFTPNTKTKHFVDAENGWYRYESRFALPVYGENGEVERYNVFHVYMIVRHDRNGKRFLYDVINIKKETSTPPSC